MTSRTIEEAKNSILLAKQKLAGVPAGLNFTNAAIRAGFSGMAEKFLLERSRLGGNLTADEWFDPYVNNFLSVARGKNVELYNEKLDQYATRQDVVDDISIEMEIEERRNSKRKSYEMIAHDMILWHLVDDKRPAYIESPIDANDWILTVDFRFIDFDKRKRNQATSSVPTCLHPTSLIQLLQFWVPRTSEFEEAILGSLRLPFLFQEFDAEAERTTLRILKGIGRFENSQNLSEDAITDVVLNDGLRSRIKSEMNEDAESTLIRDALIDEMKAREDTKTAHNQQLRDELNISAAKLSTLNDEKKDRDEAIEQLKVRVGEKESKARHLELKLQKQEDEIEVLKANWEEREVSENRTRTRVRYFGLLATIIIVATALAWLCAELFPELASLIGICATRFLAGVVVFIILHLLLELTVGRKESMKVLWPFQLVSQFRGWLWTMVVIGLVFQIGVNLFANQIQEELDSRKTSQSTPTTPPQRR